MVKIMKKAVATLLVLAFATGCAGTTTTSLQSSTSSVASGEKIKIGVLQLAEHSALENAYNGFADGLKEAGYIDGENIVIDRKNAQGDIANADTIASKLVNDKNNLILAIATPAAQSVANKTKDIPILITAVTDPVDAKLAASVDAPGGNVTGTSDLNPLSEQADLIMEFVPKAKTVAVMYTSSEINSEIQAKKMEEILKAKGVTVKFATVVTSNDVKQVVESLKGVDAIYVPTDNILSDAMATVSDVCNANAIPLFAAEPAGVENGALATYGIDYYKLGKLTAQMAVEILRDGKKPAEMPIVYSKEYSLIINKKTADTIKFTIPEAALSRAEKVIE